MAIEIISDPGLSTSNSFCSLEEYKLFISTRLPVVSIGDITGEELIALIESGDMDEELKRSLVSSTRLLCTSILWNGTITNSIQKLSFPRLDLKDSEGRNVDSSLNPQEIKDAECELSLYLLSSSDILADNEARRLGVKSVNAGVSVEFQSETMSWDLFNLNSVQTSIELLYTRFPTSVLSLIPLSWYKRVLPTALGKRIPFLVTN